MSQLTGACLCGAARYTTTAEPVLSAVCHCRDCQRFTGSAFGALVAVPKEALTIVGTMKTFTRLGGSGMPVLRHFCPECGSSIAEETASAVVLNVGTLDEPKSIAPTLESVFRGRIPLGADDWRHAALRQTAGLTAQPDTARPRAAEARDRCHIGFVGRR
jgi:hypothetical protein